MLCKAFILHIVKHFILGHGYTFKIHVRQLFSKLFYLPSGKGSILKEKNLLLKFFPFRVDLFLDGTLYPGKQTGSSKLSPL